MTAKRFRSARISRWNYLGQRENACSQTNCTHPILTYLKSEHVGAYNWGFVAGKTQTIYPWNSWEKPYTDEPSVWFHDIFHPDGSPYSSTARPSRNLRSGWTLLLRIDWGLRFPIHSEGATM